jgi:hypothetical protein
MTIELFHFAHNKMIKIKMTYVYFTEFNFSIDRSFK